MFECSMPRLLLLTRNDIQLQMATQASKYHFSSRVRNDTNAAGVYQSLTQVRNNTNARYSPLKAVDINPRLKQETMDNTQTSLE